MTELDRLRAERELHGLAVQLTATMAAPYWYPFRHAMISTLLTQLAARFAVYEPRVDAVPVLSPPACAHDRRRARVPESSLGDESDYVWECVACGQALR